MGNKLCSNGKELQNGQTRQSQAGWQAKKDSHLLRLWAEVFRVQDTEFGWERVSDDVVPINITCQEQCSPGRVYQITAYNRSALKLFDARVIHPGTQLYQANECFVHWKDLVHNCEWGLNFTSALDARRFYDCCAAQSSTVAGQRLYAKSASSTSLRNTGGSPTRAQSQMTPRRSHPDGLQDGGCTCPPVEHPGCASVPAVKRRAFAGTRSRSEDDRALEATAAAAAAAASGRPAPGGQYEQLAYRDPRPPRKETSVDDILQDWTAVARNLQHLPPESPEIPVDGRTLDRLLSAFPEVSASPTPPSLQQLQQQQLQQQHYNRTYTVDTLPNTPLNLAPRRINSVRLPGGRWSEQDEAASVAATHGRSQTLPVEPDTNLNVGSSSDYAVHRQYQHASSSQLQRRLPDSKLQQQEEAAWRSDSDAGSVTSLDSSLSTMHSASQASVARQSEAIRKSGWLHVKNWLVHKRRRVELAPQRRWRKYWVCLKGTVLLFFKDCEEYPTEKRMPKHSLPIEGCIAQPLPEHPKKEHVLSLSTAIGDAYMLQAPDKSELDSWVAALHSACASQIARQHSKSDTVRLIKSEIAQLELKVDLDSKLKMMEELHLSDASDSRRRHNSLRNIQHCEENVERLLIELYRHRCYMASLLGQELPNPKSILSNVSKASKLVLSKLDLFNLTAFHALVCARAPLTTAAMRFANHDKAQSGKRQSRLEPDDDQPPQQPCQRHPRQEMPEDHPMVESEQSGTPRLPWRQLSCREPSPSDAGAAAAAATAASVASGMVGAASCATLPRQPHQQPQHRQHQQDEQHQQQARAKSDMHIPRSTSSGVTDNTPSSSELSYGRSARLLESGCGSFVGIRLPTGEILTTRVQEGMAVQEILELVCYQSGLDPRSHYIRLRLSERGIDIIPDNYTVFENQEFQLAELCEKLTYKCLLHKRAGNRHYGMTVEAELCEDGDQQEDLCVFVAEIEPGSSAQEAGLMVGDEIVMVNDQLVRKQDMLYIESLFETSNSLNLLVRSCQSQREEATSASHHRSPELQQLSMLPQEQQPQKQQQQQPQQQQMRPPVNPAAPNRHSNSSELSIVSSQSSQSRLPSHERLRLGIYELLDTERTYVGCLHFLLDTYLLPMRQLGLPRYPELEQLTDTTSQILQFQQLFLRSLEDAAKLEPEMQKFCDPALFKKILLFMAGSFIYHAEHFKLYSSFCACHTKCRRLLGSGENQILKAFLASRNPNQEQQSSSLDSLLIKPIQRILKYPLLLQNLSGQASPGSEEQTQLLNALKGMETVAEHINDMQKINEEFGAIFDELTRIFRENQPNKRLVDLGIGELQMYGKVKWQNSGDNLGKMKKNTDLFNTCFVFRSAVVLLCQERPREKQRKNSKPNLLSQQQPSCHSNGGSGGDLVRFQTLIPVAEVEVRWGHSSQSVSAADAGMNLWELVHLRSDAERRPEKIYQLSNSSVEARNDFLKTIRQAIRNSVRQMSLPRSPQPHQQPSRASPPVDDRRARPHPPVRTTSQLSRRRPQSPTPPAPSGSRDPVSPTMSGPAAGTPIVESARPPSTATTRR